jgi:hypothetical protein
LKGEIAMQQPLSMLVSPTDRNLNSVQRVLRSLIWFGIFFFLLILTLFAATLLVIS